jgi:hypothetical protein
MHHHSRPDSPTTAATFPTDPSGLPEAGRPQLLELADGDTLDLTIGPVAKHLRDTTVRMLGSIPRPTLKVRQGSEIIVHVTNEGIWTPPCIELRRHRRTGEVDAGGHAVS